MSCFICSDKHIILISVIYTEEVYNFIKIPYKEASDVVTMANTLLLANHNAYDERYKDIRKFPTLKKINLDKFIKFEKGKSYLDEWLFAEYCQLLLRNYSVVTKLKLCQCLDYQCSAWSGWRESEAKRILDECISKLLSQLEGYDEAPWWI